MVRVGLGECQRIAEESIEYAEKTWTPKITRPREKAGPRAREGEEEACRDFFDSKQWMFFGFGSQGILDGEPKMQINVKVEVGGAEQEGFQRPVLVGGGRGVVALGLQRAEQTSCGAYSGLSGSALPSMFPNYEVSTVIAPSKKSTVFCLLKWSPPANSAGDGPVI